MGVKLRFTKKCAGRDPGHEEEIFDETLAHAWMDAGVAVQIGGNRRAIPNPQPVERSVEAPPKHTAIRGPRRRKSR